MASLIAAVIIIIALVFIATLFFWIIIPDEGNEENGNSTPTATPAISMNWNEDPEEPGNYVGNVVSISGTSSIDTDDVTITVTHGSQSGSQDLDEIAGGLSLQVGDLTLDFTDLTPTEKLGAEDIFSIVGGQSGDVIGLGHVPTSGLMCSTTLT